MWERRLEVESTTELAVVDELCHFVALVELVEGPLECGVERGQWSLPLHEPGFPPCCGGHGLQSLAYETSRTGMYEFLTYCRNFSGYICSGEKVECSKERQYLEDFL